MKASATASIHGVMREEENQAITKLTSTIKIKEGNRQSWYKDEYLIGCMDK
jgi:hypothetical protein